MNAGASVLHHRDVDRHGRVSDRRLTKIHGGPASGLMKRNTKEQEELHDRPRDQTMVSNVDKMTEKDTTVGRGHHRDVDLI